MRSIERRYNRIVDKNPDLSSFICFVETVREQGFYKSSVRLWFDKLVDKQDYRRAEKEDILAWMFKLI